MEDRCFKFINELNSYKITYNLLGKFIVLEDDLDIAFCTNLNYELIDCYSDYFLYSIIKPIQILIEIIPIVYHLSNYILHQF